MSEELRADVPGADKDPFAAPEQAVAAELFRLEGFYVRPGEWTGFLWGKRHEILPRRAHSKGSATLAT
jgi:hypothetical protein